MQVQAFLCDAVSTRDNLLHVLGGGITRIWRDSLPAAMNVDLAMLILMHPLEAQEPHTFRIVIQNADGSRLAELGGQFQMSSGDEAPQVPAGERLSFAVGLPLRPVALQEYGAHSVEILVDSQHSDSLYFAVEPAPPSQAS